MLRDRFNRDVEWRPSAEWGFILTPVDCPEGIAENGAFYAFVNDEGCWAIYASFRSEAEPLATGFEGGREAAENRLMYEGVLTYVTVIVALPVC